jgi:hypothetical protein
VSLVAEFRIARPARPLTDRWRQLPVQPRGATMLGLSFRPLQATALGLDPDAALGRLLGYPYQLVRLAAYWNQIEPGPGTFRPDALDRQLAAAERAGKQVILCVGAVKSFGYPEFFVPAHHLPEPLPEGTVIRPQARRRLLDAATGFVARLVRRYADREAVVAWQVEHEAVDPLGMEHSWRLAEAFARAEIDAVRAADPGRPVLMNGFLPTSWPVGVQQRWRTRGQGDCRVSRAIAAAVASRASISRAGLVSTITCTACFPGLAKLCTAPGATRTESPGFSVLDRFLTRSRSRPSTTVKTSSCRGCA